MVMPAGKPSITPPTPGPCDSPKLVKQKIFPNELNICNMSNLTTIIILSIFGEFS